MRQFTPEHRAKLAFAAKRRYGFRVIDPRPCPECGLEFSPPIKKAKVATFCSWPCKQKAFRRAGREAQKAKKHSKLKPCPKCQSVFAGNRKYCSPICTDVGFRESMRNELERRKRTGLKFGGFFERPRILKDWACRSCGSKQQLPQGEARARKFCSASCASLARVGIYIPNSKHIEQRAERDKYRIDALAMYDSGIGAKTISKRLGTTPQVIRRLLIFEGVYQPYKLKTPPGSGLNSKCDNKEKRDRIYARDMEKMRRRVSKCLSSKAPRKPKWENEMDRYRNDPQFRMKVTLRKRVVKLVKRENKSAKTLELLGCSLEQFMKHIESMFMEGMNWSNHGIGRGKWNIDHILPCASFDLTRADQQRICFHFTNLQPLWSLDNIRKGARIGKHTSPMLPLSYL